MKSFRVLCKTPWHSVHGPPLFWHRPAREVKSNVTLEHNGKTASAKSPADLVPHAEKGSVITFTIEGPDEESATRCDPGCPEQHRPQDKTSNILSVAFYGTKDYDRIFSVSFQRTKVKPYIVRYQIFQPLSDHRVCTSGKADLTLSAFSSTMKLPVRSSRFSPRAAPSSFLLRPRGLQQC